MARNSETPNGTARQQARRLGSGMHRVFGFGLSILVLAMMSMAVIPAMVAANGEVAWGAIVVGQAIGAIGAVAVGYGWGVFGPARIAGSTPTERRAEYLEAIRAEMVLLVPVAAIAAVAACALAPGELELAAVGAVAATTVGLTPSWYFVGLAQPYAMLLLDTIPRAGGTGVGIVLMRLGHSALTGLIGMLAGVIAGVIVSTAWILWSTGREGAERVSPRALRTVLMEHRHGIASSLGVSTYYAAPLMIVSVVAPGIQPTFALADKVQKQAAVALAPASTVLQGWVPRVTGSDRIGRAKTALVAGSGFAIAIGVGAATLLPFLTNWLGNGEISLSLGAVVLMALCISITFIERVFEVAVLAPFERLDVVTRAIAVSSIIGLPLVALGAAFLGAVGALGGVLSGVVICVVIECIEFVHTIREPMRSGSDGQLTVVQGMPDELNEARW